jgi:hypothetical protein
MYKLRLLFKKFAWCIPVLIMTLSIVYFINLFDRVYQRDLIRQSNEKYQLVNFVEHLNTKTNTFLALNTIDSFLDTHTYILTKDLKRVHERYHTSGCPFRFKKHPYEIDEFRKEMLENDRGSFVYGICASKPMYWDYRWITIEGSQYLVMVGVTNYPLDAIDKELQIAIGLLLFFTSLLNWLLVGYAKHLRQQRRLLENKGEK